MTIRFEIHLPITDASHVVAAMAGAMAEHGDFSKQQLKSILQKGAVWLENDQHIQRVRRATRPLKAGEILHVYYDAEVLAAEPVAPVLVADEGEYSVWNKPYGVRCQGSKWGDHCTVARWVEQHLQPQRPAFVVHRLDRAASGLLLLAHGKKTAIALSAMFAKRQIEKHYQVWVEGEFPAEQQVFEQPIAAKEARSIVTLLRFEPAQNRSLLDVKIDTGRKHQIRVHLAEAGFPVIGDRLYGNAEQGAEDLQLQAVSLEFYCPVSEREKRFTLV